MITKPLVSVIIPTYKRSDMLIRAIESVLSQTYDNIEIVVVDDNDPNTEWRVTTEQRMSVYKNNSKIRYICHTCNRNGSVARNTGLKHAMGEIITYLDDDDIYLPNKVETQVDFLLKNPKYRAVYCGWIRNNSYVMPDGEGDLSFGMLCGTNIIITNSIMMWRVDAVNCGGWDENLRRHQEAAFLLNYFRYGGLIGRVNGYLVEFDLSDRGNAIDSSQNESVLKYLLSKYDDLLERGEKDKKGNKKLVYAYRYRAIVLCHLKQHNYYQAIKAYLKSPLIINKLLWNYILDRWEK